MNEYKSNRLNLYFGLYWLVFWAFNGLDKFLDKSSIGIFMWYGKDREWQFLTYFTNMQLPLNWVTPLLQLTGIIELLIAAIFAMFLIHKLFSKKPAKSLTIYNIGLEISAVIFIGFSAFDVMSGDRAELLEHGTYVALIGVSYLVAQVGKATADE